MNRLTKEQLAELDKRVLADMKNRAGTWRSPWSDDTMRWAWRVEPTCTTCKAPLPYGAGVTINGKPWCSGCAPAEATP